MLEEKATACHLLVGDAMVGIKTSMLEEKATACHLLVTYIQQLEEAFFPYLEQVGKEMKPLLSFLYHEDVRLSAIQSMAGTTPFLL
ncbi:hypothetical protein T484DRAFT_1834556 [Baffinella frigidus]|nr:hypothetical protein T484DRAFT_1834556 [Cryptophyta sp. CCMP2293]